MIAPSDKRADQHHCALTRETDDCLRNRSIDLALHTLVFGDGDLRINVVGIVGVDPADADTVSGSCSQPTIIW
jgi:hypothetical protein